jgi:hypothetical protein
LICWRFVVTKETELIVWIENKPGNLAKLGTVLKQRNVNIRAILASGGKEKMPVHLMVDKVTEAREAFKELGLDVEEREVVTFVLDNQPGTLGETAEKVGDKGINIDYAYFSTMEGQGRAFVVIGAADANGVERAS